MFLKLICQQFCVNYDPLFLNKINLYYSDFVPHIFVIKYKLASFKWSF